MSWGWQHHSSGWAHDRLLTLIEGPNPVAVLNAGTVFTRDVAAVTHLAYMDSAGVIWGLTGAGALLHSLQNAYDDGNTIAIVPGTPVALSGTPPMDGAVQTIVAALNADGAVGLAVTMTRPAPGLGAGQGVAAIQAFIDGHAADNATSDVAGVFVGGPTVATPARTAAFAAGLGPGGLGFTTILTSYQHDLLIGPPIRTTDGTGLNTHVRAGNALGVGPSAGGTAILQGGNGVGGGAQGNVQLIGARIDVDAVEIDAVSQDTTFNVRDNRVSGLSFRSGNAGPVITLAHFQTTVGAERVVMDSALQIAFSLFAGRTPVSGVGAYTVAAADLFLDVDASAVSPKVIDLPTLATSAGRTIIIRKSDVSGNAVRLDGAGAETINGMATRDLTLQYESVWLTAMPADWAMY